MLSSFPIVPRALMAVIFCLLGTLVAQAGGVYEMKKGDTLYSIARANKTTVAKLKAINGIRDHTNLQIGQRIKLSSTSSSSSAKKVATRTTTTTTRTSNVGRGRRVVIDAGHGGHDYGAHYRGVRESDLNLRVAKKLESYLKQRGYSTTMTRRSDVFLSLSRRASIGNRYRNAIFVSIHFNATTNSGVRGVETFHAGSSKGKALASAIQNQMVRRLGTKNRGVRSRRFTVLTQTRIPAVLVECGFISNASERARCATSSYQSSAARAIADGIERYRW